MNSLQDLNDLVFFAEVVERGGFSAASRALDIPKSRLSRRIAQLEASLGVQLLQRSTRRLSLTPAGEVYLRHCIAVREAAEAGAAEVAQVRKEPRGLVRLSCPVTLAQSNVGPALPEFFRRHPGVQLEMRVMNRPVDPVEEGVDIALRVRNEVENSATLASRVFGRSKLLLVGTPALLARHEPLTHPESLEQVECVSMSAADARAGTLLQGPGGATHLLMQTPRYLANDLLTLSFAVEQGVGIGFLPDYLCREALQAGRLQSVLPDWQPPPGLVHAMFTPRRALVPAVRAVLDFLGEVLAEAPNRTGSV